MSPMGHRSDQIQQCERTVVCNEYQKSPSLPEAILCEGAYFEDLQGKIEAGATQEFLFTAWCSHSLEFAANLRTLQFKIEYDKLWGV